MKTIKELVLIAFLVATIEAAKLAIYYLPNIELVTLLFILYASVFPKRIAFITSFMFVTFEMVIWGVGEWLIGYYIAWPLLVLLVIILKSIFKTNRDFWALFAGAYGLLFGLLFALIHALFYGISFGIAYWIKGLTFDLIHCFSNYIIVLLLYKPLYDALEKLIKRLELANE